MRLDCHFTLVPDPHAFLASVEVNLPDVRKQKRPTITGALGRVRFDFAGMNYFRIATITQDSYRPSATNSTQLVDSFSSHVHRRLHDLASILAIRVLG